MSATPDSRLANPEQRIADLQRANEELRRKLDERTTERDAALARETATAEVLGVINSSPGDLAPVFDAILAQAMRLCDSSFGFCSMLEEEYFVQVAQRGIPSEVLDAVPRRIRGSPGGSLERLIDGEAVVHVADLADSAAYRSGNVARVPVVDIGGARTAAWVALRREQTLFGCLVFYRREVRPFTDKQIALLQNFAAQAVIAMENARLITETRAALEQQTATAEVLGVINSSPGDLEPVFDAILEKALALSEASYGGISTYDGERFHVMARRGATPEYLDFIRTYTAPPLSPNSGLGRIARGERIVHIVDMADDDLYRAGDPLRVATVDLLGGRTCVWVALHKEGRLLGMLNVYRRQVRPFTDKQIALLQNFAAQAVIAVENARLLGELRQRTDDVQEALEYQTAISDVLKVISRSTVDLQPVLDTLCETAARLCDASTARIALQREDSYRYVSSFVGRAISPEWDAMVRKMRFTAGRGTVTGRALLERQTVHEADIASYPEHDLPETFTVGGIRTLLAVPLLREDELIGLITLSRTNVDPFKDRQIELVRTFADQAVIAMENARLLGELRQRTDEVAELNRGLEARVAEQVDELGRVGRLKRFLAPQLAELIVSHGDEKILESHRREIVVVFCDLRGYTAFTETAEPEEVLDFLREYHGALGPLVSQFEGTLDQFSGDGIMVFFNDPVPCPDPAERAVKMAMAMREAAGELIIAWRTRGCELGFGVGIAWGYATLGQIGFSDRSGYTAIGTVCNLASRLCDEAKDGQILITSRVAAAVGTLGSLEDLGNLELKGLTRPVAAFNVAQSTNMADARPRLTVVTHEPGA